MKPGIFLKLTAVLAAITMVFAMAPLTGGSTVYADSSHADGGPVLSNSADNAKAAFGESNISTSYSGGTLTITLQKDIELDSPVVLITSGYHMDRSVRAARKAGFSKILRLPVSSDPLTYGASLIWETVMEIYEWAR